MSNIVQKLRSSNEKPLQMVAIVSGSILWVLIAWGAWVAVNAPDPKISAMARVYVFYFIAFAIFYVVSSAAYKATAFGNMVLLGPKQFPALHAMVVDGAQSLGLSPTPKTFLYNSNGLFNAFARRILGGRYVFLTSALVEADSDEQVRSSSVTNSATTRPAISTPGSTS